jgi:hypothetical protein
LFMKLARKSPTPRITRKPPTPTPTLTSPEVKEISVARPKPTDMTMMPAVRNRGEEWRNCTPSTVRKLRSKPSGSASGGGTMPRSIIAMRSRISNSRKRPLVTVETIPAMMPPAIATMATVNGEKKMLSIPMQPPGNAGLNTLDRDRRGIVSEARLKQFPPAGALMNVG